MTTVDGVIQPGAATAVPGDVMRREAAAILIRCHRFLEQAVPTAPGLGALVPSLVAAVSLYAAEQYQACLIQAGACLTAIAQARAAQPGLPAL